MRNPDRINEVLGLIGDIWNCGQHSDLRFFQLVGVFQSYVNGTNRQPHDADVFYVDDDVLLKALRKYKEGL